MRLPIVIVPGIPGLGAGDQYVDDIFFGFNSGSTYVRIGSNGDPMARQFEGPIMRLLVDHGYSLHVPGGRFNALLEAEDGSVPPNTIWFHRYFQVKQQVGAFGSDAQSVELAARDLLKLIKLVLRKTGAPKVNLVAHSIGGLIGRSLLQKVIAENEGLSAADLVDKFFTYATPHGGLPSTARQGSSSATGALLEEANPRRMWRYLEPGAGEDPPPWWSPLDIPLDAFPADRVFTLAGTLSESSTAAFERIGSEALRSEGVVALDNAYLPKSYHAFVHRSHAGRLGVVNSQEGYENLRRFLFGDLVVVASLRGAHLPESEELSWQGEIEVSVRGIPVLLHQRTVEHVCPIVFAREARVNGDRSIPLTSLFLMTGSHNTSVRGAIRLRIVSLRERHGQEESFESLGGSAEFDDSLVVDIGSLDDGSVALWAQWQSSIPLLRDYVPAGDPLASPAEVGDSWAYSVPVPSRARQIFGDAARVELLVRHR